MKYMIYKMVDSSNDVWLEFFLPDDSLSRIFSRKAKLMSLRQQGYRVAGVLYVDKETYLNARLAESVKEYCKTDNYEQEVRRNYAQGLITEKIAMETLTSIQDYKWTLMKIIYHQVNRLINSDYTCDNEIALALYDKYVKAIL